MNMNRGNAVRVMQPTGACGVNIVITPCTCCANLCQDVTYTITITNNCSTELISPVLNVSYCDSLCIMQGSVKVNDVVQPTNMLNCLLLPNIPQGEKVTIVFVGKIMTTERYVKVCCYLDCSVCCCFEPKCIRTVSAPCCIQVCPCCCGCNNPR